MGFPLPDELIGLVFGQLDVPSLLRCMQVCKSFHSITSGNTHLCYKIELFASCMEDNENSSMDTVSRLNVLREYNRAWNEMELTTHGSIPMRRGICWEFSDGILAQSTLEKELFFAQLPCPLKGIAERRWFLPYDFSLRDFTFDNSQDLTVLLELTGNFPDITCKLHLLTMTGKRHPGSAVTQMTHVLEDLPGGFTTLMQICGCHIAVFFYSHINIPANSSSLLIWNWRTGHREVYIHTPEFQSFAFMTEDLILAAIPRTDSELMLRVLSITALVDPVHSLESMPYVCQLHYPKLEKEVGYLLIRSDPPPGWRPPAGSDVPFHCSPKDIIFTITIYDPLEDEDQEETEGTVLCVPLSTLLSEVEHSRDAPRRNVTWNDWGPNRTRLIFRNPSTTWVCYTYGMKTVHGLQWEGRDIAQVYDFNPYTLRRHVKTSVDSPIAWTLLEEQSETNDRYVTSANEVVATLPGRVTSPQLHHLGRWEAVMIGENHIVVVQVTPSPSSIQRLLWLTPSFSSF